MAQACRRAPKRRRLIRTEAMEIAARGRPRLLFARSFLANPRGTGSVIPSSRRLTQRLLAGFDWSTAKTVVEYGPGTGVVTRALLSHMGPEARLFAFEINAEFVAYLRTSIPDSRLTVVEASAETVEAVLAQHGLTHCDAAVSSLPFSIMPPRVRLRIVAATAGVLAPGAHLVGYQYSTRWLRELRRGFSQVTVRFEPRNWPPAFVFTARQD
jgi:phospholipid N-methyltransferase